MEANERNPLKWSAVMWTHVLRILAAYIFKWSGADSPRELDPEARDEIRSRIVMDICTGDIPDGMSPIHYVFRTARRWRMRGWNGDTETDRIRKRAERAAARKSLSDPGSAESETARNKSPYRGASEAAKTPTPLAMLIAAETAAREGLWYISDRQRKARRKPVKGKTIPTYRIRVTGFAGKPRVGFGANGRPLYFPGARTLIMWEPIAPAAEFDYDRKARRYVPHVTHTGTIANRDIGKVKADPIGPARIGEALAAVLGEPEESRRFVPPATPSRGVPAMAGDGTEFRPARQ